MGGGRRNKKILKTKCGSREVENSVTSKGGRVCGSGGVEGTEEALEAGYRYSVQVQGTGTRYSVQVQGTGYRVQVQGVTGKSGSFWVAMEAGGQQKLAPARITTAEDTATV